MILETIDKTNNGTIDEWHYHHEDQLGTLGGMTDENGNRIAEIDTGKYGQVFQKDILFDGRPSRVGEAYSPEEGLTRIDLASGHTYPETVEGAVLRAADANGAYTAIVTDLDSTNFEWIELDDASGDVLDAVSAGADFVSHGRGASAQVRSLRELFDNRIGSVSGGAHTGGTWEDSVYISGPDTSLIDAGENFDSYIVGWHVQVDAGVPVYFEILDANGDEITVSGDVTGLITEGETEFCIIHPVGVDPETGTTQEDPCVPESRYIWGGGLYLPPIAGFTTNLGVEGAQGGGNMSGQHYMWNRVYDINTGRWTTPDPAAQPWWNLSDYCHNAPVSCADARGLSSVMKPEVPAISRLKPLRKAGTKPPPGSAPEGKLGDQSTRGDHKNCLGDALGEDDWINWVDPDKVIRKVGAQTLEDAKDEKQQAESKQAHDADYSDAIGLRPEGFVGVNPDGVSYGATRCDCGETEIIVWISSAEYMGGDGQRYHTIRRYVSFHVIARKIECDCDGQFIPTPWHTKLGKNAEVTDIYDAGAHINKHFPGYHSGRIHPTANGVYAYRYSRTFKQVLCGTPGGTPLKGAND